MNQKIIQFPKTDLCSSLSAIGEENNKYVAAVTAIENTMVTLSQMSMPPKTDFANEPKTYDQIADCYKKIQNLAVEFTTKIYSELEHYPNACITSLERIDASLKKAQEKVDFIMSNPKLSEDDLSYEANLLARYMDAIAEEADGQIADLNILIDNLEKFKEKSVQTIEATMKTILDDIKIETAEYQAAEKALEEAKKALEKEINDACELSCDEAVVRALPEEGKKAYGDTLLMCSKTAYLKKSSVPSPTLTEGGKQLKERLGAIMNFKSKTKTIRFLTVVLTLFILSGAVFIGGYPVSAATDPNGTSKSSIPEKKAMEKSTYIYDENLGYGWYLDDENLDNNDLENANSYQYFYTQNGYYCNSYIIEMGWNLYAKNQDYYGATEIVFEDESKMTVYFSDSVKDYLNDREAISAIEELIYSLKNTDISPAIEMPLIISITPVGADDIPGLTEQYFQNEDLIRFSALFSVLDETTQKDYYKKVYDADKIALFSTIIQDMDTDLVLQYVDQSEQDNKTNFFAVLSNYMPLSDLKRYIEKYYENNNIARFTILLDYMTKEEKQEWLKRAQTDRKTNFVAVLSNELLD